MWKFRMNRETSPLTPRQNDAMDQILSGEPCSNADIGQEMEISDEGVKKLFSGNEDRYRYGAGPSQKGILKIAEEISQRPTRRYGVPHALKEYIIQELED